MHNWFECRITCNKLQEDGMQKRVTEPFISGEFTVSVVKRSRISEMFFNESGDRFYKMKVYFITLDEKGGAEKKKAATMYVQACDLKEAIGVLEEGMKGTLADYTIASVTEMAVVDVFPYTTE